MRKFTKNVFAYSVILCAVFFVSCKDDSYLNVVPPIPDQSFVEEFDTFTNAQARGWRVVNRSFPIGSTSWSQTGGFPAYSSVATANGYAYVSFNAAGDPGSSGNLPVCNAWLISKPIMMQNGDKITFYTKTLGVAFPDRLQVRLNVRNDGFEVGRGDGFQVGDFTEPLLDINPTLTNMAPFAYPVDWTRFTATISGLSKPGMHRFGFRYFVEDGGPTGINSNGVGVDSVAYQSIKP
jgi:hypothetical protein